jgi:hypothetical protein
LLRLARVLARGVFVSDDLIGKLIGYGLPSIKKTAKRALDPNAQVNLLQQKDR